MNKLLLAAALLGATAVNAQVVHDTVSIGAGYANQVWYSLENGIQKTEPKNNWDLGFEITGFSASILFNHVTGAALWSYPNGDTGTWATLDTTGIDAWSTRVFNSTESWEQGAFNVGYDASNDNDLGWGVYNSVNHHVTGDSLYVVKTASGAYKKLWIINLASGAYNFKLADLDGSNEITRELKKADFTDRNFGYYSITNDANLDREPLSANWDLVFMHYAEGYAPGYGVVTATGVLQNKEIQAAKVYPIDSAEVETFIDYKSATFEDHINVIGRHWKAINMTTFEWDIEDSTVYFCYGQNGKLWKLVMRGFGGSADGNFIFSKEQIEIIPDTVTAVVDGVTVYVVDGDTYELWDGEYVPYGVLDIRAEKPLVHLYPNPAADGHVSVVYDLKTAEAATLRIFNLHGALMREEWLTGAGLSAHHVETASLPAGPYFVQVRTDAVSVTQKLIIR